MFPTFGVNISGLEPSKKYCIFLQLIAVENCRFKYSASGGWCAGGQAEHQSERQLYLHPQSPNTGEHWTSQSINFKDIRITNTASPPKDQVVLNSMHKYQPRLIILQSDKAEALGRAPLKCIEFPETAFIAVTAYQNTKVTQLKIYTNKYAKGFRKNSRSNAKRKETCTKETDENHKRSKRQRSVTSSLSSSPFSNTSDSSLGASPLYSISSPPSSYSFYPINAQPSPYSGYPNSLQGITMSSAYQPHYYDSCGYSSYHTHNHYLSWPPYYYSYVPTVTTQFSTFSTIAETVPFVPTLRAQSSIFSTNVETVSCVPTLTTQFSSLSTNDKTVSTNAETVSTNAETVLPDAETVSCVPTLTAQFSILSTNDKTVSTKAEAVSTNAETVSPNAETVSCVPTSTTQFSILSTNDDPVSTNAETVSTNAETVSPNPETVLTNSETVVSSQYTNFSIKRILDKN